ncbi:MAG: hypothetical protein ACKO1U_06625 [Bacteroidota bacterium]
MNRQILHNQLRHRLDDLVEKHQELAARPDSIPSGEMNQFLADIRLVYELSLALHHQNAIRSMDDLELAIAQRFSGEVKQEDPQPAPPPEPMPHSIEQVMVDAINLTEEEKVQTVKPSLRITGDVQALFEAQESIADQFKESVTLAETMAPKSSQPRISEKHKHITDLTTAIGINERFYYIQHLFAGNAGVYHLTLERLNKENDRDAAMTYLNSEVAGKYGWDSSAQAVRNFMELVERRFNA